MLFAILGVALACVAAFLYLLLKKRYRGLALGLAMFVATVLAGLWAIFQSRSSTAAIGIVFLPFYGLLAGGAAWLSATYRGSDRSAPRGLGWLFLAAALGAPAFLVYQGFSTIALNQSRDAKHKAGLAEIERNKLAIADALARNPGRESATIDALIGAHATDRNYLLPALESKYVSPDALDHLARSDDLGIALSAVRNPNCRPDTLARIYRTHAYPDYFFQALAAHEHTPPDILTDLHRRPASINGLDRSLAGNPATPGEILLEIATTTRDIFVIQRLLQNPKLDCALIALTEAALKRSDRPEDNFSRVRLQELKPGRCA